MKGLTIGIIEVYSDDADSFKKLIEVAKEANQMLAEEEEHWTKRFFKELKEILRLGKS